MPEPYQSGSLLTSPLAVLTYWESPALPLPCMRGRSLIRVLEELTSLLPGNRTVVLTHDSHSLVEGHTSLPRDVGLLLLLPPRLLLSRSRVELWEHVTILLDDEYDRLHRELARLQDDALFLLLQEQTEPTRRLSPSSFSQLHLAYQLPLCLQLSRWVDPDVESDE